MAQNTVIRTNMLALNSHRQLGLVGRQQATSSQRLSSGYRVNTAADDAAGLAISEKMRAQIRGLNQASSNTQDAISLIQTAEGGMQEIDNMVQRIRELVVYAANDHLDQATRGDVQGDRRKIQDEIDQLLQEIDSMANRVEFNRKILLNGSFSAVGQIRSAQQNEVAVANNEFVAASSAFGDAITESLAQINRAIDLARTDAADGTGIFGSATLAGSVGNTAEEGAAHTAMLREANTARNAAITDLQNLQRALIDLHADVSRAGTSLTEELWTNLVENNRIHDLLLGGNPAGVISHLSETNELVSGANTDQWDANLDAIVGAIVGTVAQIENPEPRGTVPNPATDPGIPDPTAPPISNPAALATILDPDWVSYIPDPDWTATVPGAGYPTDPHDYTTNPVPQGTVANPVSQGYIANPDFVTGAPATIPGTATLPTPGWATYVDDPDWNTYIDDPDGELAGGAVGPRPQSVPDSYGAELVDAAVAVVEARNNAIDNAVIGTALHFQIGANANQSLRLNIGAVDTFSLGLAAGLGDSGKLIDVMQITGSDVTGLINRLDTAQTVVATERSRLGAAQNRLEFTDNSLRISSENLSAAESRIRNTDMGAEMMRLTQSNILQQAAISMLAQGNMAPQAVLQLLN